LKKEKKREEKKKRKTQLGRYWDEKAKVGRWMMRE
jgi:hypothetical protein